MEIDQKTVASKPLKVKSGGVQKKAKEKKLKQKNLKKVAMLLKKSDGIQKETKEMKLKQKNLKVPMSLKIKYSSDQPLNSMKNNLDGNSLKKVAETGSLKINQISLPKTLKKKKEVFARKHQMPFMRFPSQIDDKQRIRKNQLSDRNLKNEKQNHKKNYVQTPSIEAPSEGKGKKKFRKFNANKKNIDAQHKKTLHFRFPSVVKNKFEVKMLCRGIENVEFSKDSKSCCFVRFESEELAARALKALHCSHVQGGRLFVTKTDLGKQKQKKHSLYVTNLPKNINWKDLKSAIPRGKYYKVYKETKSAVITFHNKNIVESIINKPKKHIVCGVEVNVSDSKPAVNGKSNNETQKKQREIKSAPSKKESGEDNSDSDNEDADEHLNEKSMSNDEVAEGDSDDDKSESDDVEEDDDSDDKSESDNNEEAENVDSLNTSDGEGEENIAVEGSDDSDNADASSSIDDRGSSGDEEDDDD